MCGGWGRGRGRGELGTGPGGCHLHPLQASAKAQKRATSLSHPGRWGQMLELDSIPSPTRTPAGMRQGAQAPASRVGAQQVSGPEEGGSAISSLLSHDGTAGTGETGLQGFLLAELLQQSSQETARHSLELSRERPQREATDQEQFLPGAARPEGSLRGQAPWP